MSEKTNEVPPLTHVYVQQIRMENETCPNRRVECNPRRCNTLVDVAMALDNAEEDDIDKRGYSGRGAGAWLELLDVENAYDADGKPLNVGDIVIEGSERIASVFDTRLSGMCVGNVRRLRRYYRDQSNSSAWNGHNHVPLPLTNTHDLLDWCRGQHLTADSRFVAMNRRSADDDK